MVKRRLARDKTADKVLIVDGAIVNTALDSKPVFFGCDLQSFARVDDFLLKPRIKMLATRLIE